MPLVANTGLPTFQRLHEEGMPVLSPERARQQDIRELHIGLLNMMPDGALAATERQFFRLVGESNPIAQFHMHPFTLEGLPRGPEARAHIDSYYEPFARIREEGLDALIITGANVSHPDLAQELFWQPLIEVFEWVVENVTSTLCSCLATHAVLQFHYGQRRIARSSKLWGVFDHHVVDKHHPLVSDINTHFAVPHSRWNKITREQFDKAGLRVLVESDEGGVHLVTSADGLRIVMFQGHPEYDTVSLLKEYKREVGRYIRGELSKYPPFPRHYFGAQQRALFDEYRLRIDRARERGDQMPEFPEREIEGGLQNTWHDTAEAVIGNWMGSVYQVTHRDRRIPYMEGVDPDDPLGLGK